MEMTTIPNDVAEVIKNDLPGYKLKFAYGIQIDNTLMGLYPATSSGNGKGTDPVITDDIEVLEEIWRKLPPRKSKVLKLLFYINQEQGIAFQVCFDRDNLLSYPAIPLITKDKLAELLNDPKHEFKWTPGIIGGDTDNYQFDQCIKRSLAWLKE